MYLQNGSTINSNFQSMSPTHKRAGHVRSRGANSFEESKHSIDVKTPIDIENSIIYNDVPAMRAPKSGLNGPKLNDSLQTKSHGLSERNQQISHLQQQGVTPKHEQQVDEPTGLSLFSRRPVAKMGSTPLALKYSSIQPFKPFSTNACGPRQKTAAAAHQGTAIHHWPSQNAPGKRATSKLPNRAKRPGRQAQPSHGLALSAENIHAKVEELAFNENKRQDGPRISEHLKMRQFVTPKHNSNLFRINLAHHPGGTSPGNKSNQSRVSRSIKQLNKIQQIQHGPRLREEILKSGPKAGNVLNSYLSGSNKSAFDTDQSSHFHPLPQDGT